MSSLENTGVVAIPLPFITHSQAIERLRRLCSIEAQFIDKVELYDIRDELISSEQIASCVATLLGKYCPNDVVIKSIREVIDYDWQAELQHFCNEKGYEMQSQDNLKDWILELRRLGETDHVFYHIMVVKDYLDNL